MDLKTNTKTRLVRLSLALLCMGASAAEPGEPRPASSEEIRGLQVVDCLLPGQLRRLGQSRYMTSRRPIKTSAADCAIRGGEYTAYDRADYKTALSVWLPSAEAGDAGAQVNVGEIFEKGLGTEPNYEMAALWYRKAAEQGNRRGQFNIGSLYEQGLGVTKDPAQALNWYRQAWGLPEDSIVYRSMAEQQRQQLRAELKQQLEQKQAQIALLQRQIDKLKAAQQQHKAQAKADRSAAAELALLRDLVKGLRQANVQTEEKLAGLVLRTPVKVKDYEAPGPGADVTRGKAQALSYSDTDFGKYYALVIANQDYSELNSLNTVSNDARALAEVLEQQYGFEVRLLINADRLSVMRAVNQLSESLGEDDNLLIYYGGHGSRLETGEREEGYWLPVNANPPPNDSRWVPNEFISNHLARLKAKRVLVVSDSCYAGLLSSSPGYLFFNARGQQRSQTETKAYIDYKLPRRSRLLLTSGGDKPVIDNGDNGHSVFANALLQKLRSNKTILTAPELFMGVLDRVSESAAKYDFIQQPEYKSIKGAGHEVGDFFFVPSAS